MMLKGFSRQMQSRSFLLLLIYDKSVEMKVKVVCNSSLRGVTIPPRLKVESEKCCALNGFSQLKYTEFLRTDLSSFWLDVNNLLHDTVHTNQFNRVRSKNDVELSMPTTPLL